jgi:hypothetical protein
VFSPGGLGGGGTGGVGEVLTPGGCAQVVANVFEGSVQITKLFHAVLFVLSALLYSFQLICFNSVASAIAFT